jgi:hypothetical protein
MKLNTPLEKLHTNFSKIEGESKRKCTVGEKLYIFIILDIGN